MEDLYYRGRFDECLAVLENEFSVFRRIFVDGRLLHQCQRDSTCRCIGYGRYILALAFQMGQ